MGIEIEKSGFGPSVDAEFDSIKVGAGSAAAPSVAIGASDQGFYSSGTDVRFSSGGALTWLVSDTFIDSGLTNGPQSWRFAAASNVANFRPRRGNNSGLGSNALDEVSLIADSIEVLRVDADSTAGNTRFMLYDVDNATLERVTVGAADSGGAGYKVLRIPN